MLSVLCATQENASKPEGLPPSQGGKYVGFGSGPAPASRRGNHGAGGLDDVSQVLTKGFSQLSTVAGKNSNVLLANVQTTWG